MSRLYNVLDGIITKFIQGGSGWLKVGNALIQWGRSNVSTDTASGSSAFAYRGSLLINFPKNFSTNTYTCIASIEDWAAFWAASATQHSTQSAYLHIAGNENNVTKPVSWLAIGIWGGVLRKRIISLGHFRKEVVA